jgi:hypothetical protein
VWTRRAAADLPPDWPVPIKAFIIWLVIILWKRRGGRRGLAPFRAGVPDNRFHMIEILPQRAVAGLGQ